MSLTDMVIMPGADYQAACDAIREKTEGLGYIRSGDMAELIRGISAGGAPFKIGLTTLPSGVTSFTVPDVGTEFNRFLLMAFVSMDYFSLETMAGGTKYRLAWANSTIEFMDGWYLGAIDLEYDPDYSEVYFETKGWRKSSGDPFTFGADGSVSGTISQRKIFLSGGDYMWIAWAE